jgi:DNA-directed RNA polymerase specialized sigma24 family protein
MDITPEDFERFLTWLDPDRERAAEKYPVKQAKLTRYFICRGCGVEAESLADETITRVIRKIPDIADTYVGERLPYFLGVARNVFSEYLKKSIVVRAAQPPSAPDSGEEIEQLDRCLDRCLKALKAENRELILMYYTGYKGDKIVRRKKLADELDVAPNALRIRAHRIRTDLRRCVEDCVKTKVDKDNATDVNVRELNVFGREQG